MNKQTEKTENRPVFEIKIWPVKAAIWASGEFFAVTFQKTFKDKDGAYQNTLSFNRDDCLKLAKAADVAHSWIMREEAKANRGET